MKRQELAHILRASCQIAHDNDILVMGSQAILGTFDDDELPDLVRLSREADIAFLDDPDRAKADAVEGAIAEMSTFHDTNRVYAEGVHIETAELPDGWRDRLVTWSLLSSTPASPRFVEPHDLVLSKLAAGRDKDIVFATSLLDMHPSSSTSCSTVPKCYPEAVHVCGPGCRHISDARDDQGDLVSRSSSQADSRCSLCGYLSLLDGAATRLRATEPASNGYVSHRRGSGKPMLT